MARQKIQLRDMVDKLVRIHTSVAKDSGHLSRLQLQTCKVVIRLGSAEESNALLDTEIDGVRFENTSIDFAVRAAIYDVLAVLIENEHSQVV